VTAWKLFDGDVPRMSTAEFHRDRERAPHLEQEVHRPRLYKAAELVEASAAMYRQAHPEWRDPYPVSDLGCGDGGLLSLLAVDPWTVAWGYDFQPSNVVGWAERGVRAELLDAFGADRGRVQFGCTAVVTEVLEHVADPFEVVRWIGRRTHYIVASSPWDESPDSHDACHAWAFDQDGYRGLLEQGGFEVLRHETLGRFQVVLGMAS
jgi:hypothetical protein